MLISQIAYTIIVNEIFLFKTNISKINSKEDPCNTMEL